MLEPLLHPATWLLVITISVIGSFGNVGLYYVGKGGSQSVFSHYPQLDGDSWDHVGDLYQEHGGRILIFSGLPTLGLLLTTAAGAVGIKLYSFFFWVVLSKTIRNWLLVLFFGGLVTLLP